jgi:hypothetical protein
MPVMFFNGAFPQAPLSSSRHHVRPSYHNYRGNDINDKGLQSCIFIEVDDLCRRKNHAKHHIDTLYYLPADKSLQVEFPRHHSRIIKDSIFCFFDLDWVIFS